MIFIFHSQVIQQLFEKLDVDRDGRISFEEFLLLFRSGGSWPQGSGIGESPTHSHRTNIVSWGNHSNNVYFEF